MADDNGYQRTLAATRAWKQRRKAELVTGENGRPYAPNAFRHGSLSTYNDWGCRCDACSTAQKSSAKAHLPVAGGDRP